jgi:hypothetical protein
VIVKSVVLVPYCPWPADTGGKAEIIKHLEMLRDLGHCRIVSAGRKPVGAGWTIAKREAAKKMGFEVVLREDKLRLWNTQQTIGMAYGSVAKGLTLERAFPHGNPYHRYAFPVDWWRTVSGGADLAVFNYSYWCWLPCEMPKALVLLDLWSDYMWGGHASETRDILSCDHTFAISVDEVNKLKARGVVNITWCPPAIDSVAFGLSQSCALVGSDNLFNREGLRWLETAGELVAGLDVRVYGSLSASISRPGFRALGRYEKSDQPYRDCGIILFTTVQGMGVQIKTIEALAAGRAIIARRGAVRGLPSQTEAWIEVDSPREMTEWAKKISADKELREEWGRRARAYYQKYLCAENIRYEMRQIYQRLGSR